MSATGSSRDSAQETAAAVAKKRQQTKTASDVRADRIAELRAQYEEGSYAVDAARLSKKIIDEHLSE